MVPASSSDLNLLLSLPEVKMQVSFGKANADRAQAYRHTVHRRTDIQSTGIQDNSRSSAQTQSLPFPAHTAQLG